MSGAWRSKGLSGLTPSPFYGRTGGERLSALLTEHILVAADVLAAAKAGDQAAVERHSRIWYRNGNQIADFLHETNPRHWPRAEMRAMMRYHLDLTLAEAVAHLTGTTAPTFAPTTGSTARSSAWPTCSATGSWPSSPSASSPGRVPGGARLRAARWR